MKDIVRIFMRPDGTQGIESPLIGEGRYLDLIHILNQTCCAIIETIEKDEKKIVVSPALPKPSRH